MSDIPSPIRDYYTQGANSLTILKTRETKKKRGVRSFMTLVITKKKKNDYRKIII